jgi:hypothetical protein
MKVNKNLKNRRKLTMSEVIKEKDILAALLAPDNDVIVEVPMKRFGINFKLKALSPDEMSRVQQRATRLVGKGKKVFNEEMFNYLTIIEACIVPNWKDEKVLEALGVTDPIDAIKKRLLFGEVAYLLQEIGNLNGFDQSDEEIIEEVKN